MTEAFVYEIFYANHPEGLWTATGGLDAAAIDRAAQRSVDLDLGPP
jgi:hypothetical protein